MNATVRPEDVVVDRNATILSGVPHVHPALKNKPDGETPQEPTPASNLRSKPYSYYTQEELAQRIEQLLVTDQIFREKFDAIWTALMKAYDGNLKIRKDHAEETAKFGAPFLFYSLIKHVDLVDTKGAPGVRFDSTNGQIELRHGQIQFIPAVEQSAAGQPVQKKLTFQDAYSAILLAATNEAMLPPNKLSIEGGSRHDRLMYKHAVAEYNKSVPKALRFEIYKNPAKLDLVPFTGAKKGLRDYMQPTDTVSNGSTMQEPAAPESTAPPAAQEDPENAGDPNPDLENADWSSFSSEQVSQTEAVPQKVSLEEYIGKKVAYIEEYLENNKDAVLKQIKKQAAVDKTGNFPFRNVYLLNLEGMTDGDRNYIIREKGALKLIRTQDAVSHWRDPAHVMVGDLDHPDHPAHEKAAPAQPHLQNNISFTTIEPQILMAHVFKNQEVVWANADHDVPVTLVDHFNEPAKDGRYYVTVKSALNEGTSIIPLDEVKFPKLPEIKEVSGTVTASYMPKFNL